MASWVLRPYLCVHTLPYPERAAGNAIILHTKKPKLQHLGDLLGEAQGVVCDLESDGCAALEQMLAKGWTKGKVIGKALRRCPQVKTFSKDPYLL